MKCGITLVQNLSLPTQKLQTNLQMIVRKSNCIVSWHFAYGVVAHWNTSDLTKLSTTMIMPVDLNAYVLKMGLDIAFFAYVTGESIHASHFTKASKARKKAMDSIVWDEEKGQWFGYWLNDNLTSKVYQLH